VKALRTSAFSVAAVILMVVLVVIHPPTYKGAYIDKFEYNIGDRWNYQIQYTNFTFYADFEVIDEGIISSFDKVREVYVIKAEYMFGEIKAIEFFGLTYDIHFHQKYYIDKDTLDTIRIESFLTAKITVEAVIIGGKISIYMKELDDLNYVEGAGAEIYEGGSLKQEIEQTTYLDYHTFGDLHQFGGIDSENMDDVDSEYSNDSYSNRLYFTGNKDVSVPPGNFQTKGVKTSFDLGFPVYFLTLLVVLDLLILLNWLFNNVMNILSEDDIDEPDIYYGDYEDYNRTEQHTTSTKMPAVMIDSLGDHILWRWELQDYYFVEEDKPFLGLRSFYYFIAGGVVALLVMLIVVYGFTTQKQRSKKKTTFAKKTESFQQRLEGLLDKGAAARIRRSSDEDEDDYGDFPDYNMQRNLYGSRSYGQKPARGADDTYAISPREQKDLYDHFGRSEQTRNIFEEDYPAPPPPPEKKGGKRR